MVSIFLCIEITHCAILPGLLSFLFLSLAPCLAPIASEVTTIRCYTNVYVVVVVMVVVVVQFELWLVIMSE